MPVISPDRTAFRCSVPTEHSAAKLKVGCSTLRCSVVDTSRFSFSLEMGATEFAKLGKATIGELVFGDERWLVAAESNYCLHDGRVVVGCKRLEDRTRIKAPGTTLWSFLPGYKTTADPSFLMALIIAFLSACICLPGIGDTLGTAPKVKRGVHSMLNCVYNTMK